ncbi:hypothetical protein G7K_3128-t1 [Saitoella complicata NRRL Y-17804]|uniref:Uncharacterized protein n=1 Tax=Saitoella complicata (strain BCRC 22490 / CBS 7301 / JCM 7358 / NBRC 10748 / NRRL Y-17804) TaxID=698492 RepID=A0A0E9NGG7_SAICN|nr:hypothetical protein G7K_3128-t1 [Saitoella complicata NRRL Y-17804]
MLSFADRVAYACAGDPRPRQPSTLNHSKSTFQRRFSHPLKSPSLLFDSIHCQTSSMSSGELKEKGQEPDTHSNPQIAHPVGLNPGNLQPCGHVVYAACSRGGEISMTRVSGEKKDLSSPEKKKGFVRGGISCSFGEEKGGMTSGFMRERIMELRKRLRCVTHEALKSDFVNWSYTTSLGSTKEPPTLQTADLGFRQASCEEVVCKGR